MADAVTPHAAVAIAATPRRASARTPPPPRLGDFGDRKALREEGTPIVAVFAAPRPPFWEGRSVVGEGEWGEEGDKEDGKYDAKSEGEGEGEELVGDDGTAGPSEGGVSPDAGV